MLGELELRRSGRVLALPASKKSRALVGYLAVTGRPHLREALCDLLWPGPSDPRAALRWSLTKLRALVDEGRTQRLVADRERVAFEAKGCSVDLSEVKALAGSDTSAASTESLRRAAELCRGELLEGLDLDDCYRYHEWCVSEREAARSLRVAVLSELVRREAGRPEEALVHARARVAIDPLAEAAHVEVIRILGQLGKRREALAQFETCRRILQIELGVQPSRALLHARSMLTATPTIDASTIEEPAPAEPIVSVPTHALVGRRSEQDEIAARVAEVTVGHPQPMMLFVGEPGIGKTRLLEAAGAAMLASGGTVLRARAYEAERIRPYGPWLEAIALLASSADDALKGELAPLLVAGSATLTDQGRLFDAVARLFTRAASRAPLLVAVDDIQWFDDASTALLHALCRSLPPSALVVAAARPAELADNPPMQRLVHALLREDKLVERALSSLARDEVASLARQLGADEAEAERVFAESGGHPYFAVEIARSLARGDHVLAPSLTAMIDDRLGRLGPLARGVLPWAASMRRTFDLELLGRVTNLATTELLAAITELEEHCVLAPKPGGYDFAHDLLRAAVHRRLSEPRRRLIHAQIARALRDSGDSRANDVAHHAALGGDHEMAATAALEAGRQALRVFANHEAAVVARFGIEHAAALPRDARLRLHVGLLEVVFTSRTWRDRKDELAAEAQRLAAECEAADLREEASRALHTVSSIEHESHAAPELAFANSMRAALVSKTTEPGARAERLSATAKCLTFLGREMGQAHLMLDEARELAQASGRELLDWHWGMGLVLAFEGDAGGARRELGRAIHLARVANDLWSELECSLDLALLELDEAQPRVAHDIVSALSGLAQKLEDGSEKAQVSAIVALSQLAEREAGARAAMRDAMAGLRAVDAKAMLSLCAWRLALDMLDTSTIEDARSLATEAVTASHVMHRRSDEARARAALARIELFAARPGAAAAQIEPLLAELDVPHALSARARAEVREVERLITTASPTSAPTAKAQKR